MLKFVLEKTLDIVKEAASFVKDAAFDVSEKTECVNIVTSSDLLVQRYLHEKLKEVLPEAGFYCEEEDLQEEDKEFIWVIDPIDGTMNYARRIPESAISVALLKNNVPVLGIVHNIYTGDVYAAIAGEGAKKNQIPIRVSNRKFCDALFCTAMSTYRKEMAHVCNDIIMEAYMQCNDVRRFGAAALELCYLAEGRCELYFEIRIFPWDYAAAGLILKEAGGVMSGFNGSEIPYNRPSTIIGANSIENHKTLCEIVWKHLEKDPEEK